MRYKEAIIPTIFSCFTSDADVFLFMGPSLIMLLPVYPEAEPTFDSLFQRFLEQLLTERCRNIMQSDNTRLFGRKVDLIIFGLAVCLRVALAIVNNRANDDHFEVSRLLLNGFLTGDFTEKMNSCSECYHPKLYHYICTSIFLLFRLSNPVQQIIAMQLVNVAAGIVVIVVIKDFLRNTALAPGWQSITFALIALNPRMIAVSAQSSNDTFAIMFGVLATYWLYYYLSGANRRAIIYLSLSVVLALLTKGNNLALLVSVSVSLAARFFTKLILGQSWRREFRDVAIFLVIISGLLFATPSPFSTYRQYLSRWLHTGTLTAVNFDKKPSPNWFDRTYVARPGVISIYDAYFTFRIVGLIEAPYISNAEPPVPFHRTSLWSQVYGRFHFSYYDQWPWQRIDTVTIYTGRAILLLALIPSLIALGGFLQQIVACSRSFLRDPVGYISTNAEWIFPLQILAFTAMIIWFTYDYRDFCAMKDIYLLPCLLSGVVMFAEMLKRVNIWIQKRAPVFNVALPICFSALIVLYVFNSSLLIQQLFLERLSEL